MHRLLIVTAANQRLSRSPSIKVIAPWTLRGKAGVLLLLLYLTFTNNPTCSSTRIHISKVAETIQFK